MTMKFERCNDCGEYKYIERDGKCLSCVPEQRTIDGVVEVRHDNGVEAVGDVVIEAYIGGDVVASTETESDGSFSLALDDDCTVVASVDGVDVNGYLVYAGSEKYAHPEKEVGFMYDLPTDAVEATVDERTASVVFNTDDSGVTPIANVGMLRGVNEFTDGHRFELIRDIDASETKNWTHGFKPITTFESVLDGNDYCISDLCIKPDDPVNVGLVGLNHGTIRDVVLDGIEVEGDIHVGCVAGENYGDVFCCRVSGSVHGNSKFIGGIVGMNTNHNARVHRCLFDGSVVGGNTIGGVVGNSRGSVVDTCSFGAVNGDDDVGGLVGSNKGLNGNRGVVESSFTVCKVVGGSGFGSLIGRTTDGRIDKLYWCRDTAGKMDAIGSSYRRSADIVQLTTSEMQGQQVTNTMSNLTYGHPWYVTDSFPELWQ